MQDNGESMATLAFAAGAVLIGSIGALLAVLAIRIHRRTVRTLAEGLVAEATVLDTYVTQHRSGTGESRRVTSRRHAVLAFRTHDGRDVRVDEINGGLRVTGDRVAVRYLPERPDRAIAADQGPGTAGTVIAVVFCTLFFAAGLTAAIIALTSSAPTPPPEPTGWHY